jgi:hypothetical protein
MTSRVRLSGAVRPQRIQEGLRQHKDTREPTFHRAIKRGNLMVAETVLRELGRPTLVELLELTALIGQKDRPRFSRVATRWLLRYLEARGDATLYDAQFAAAALQQLGGRRHAHAMAALRDMAESASSGSVTRRVAS